MTEAPIIRRRLEHRGGVFRLRKDLEAQGPTNSVIEVMVCGPRGSGKSNGLAYLLWKLCQMNPMVRILVIRTARSLLTDTFCKTFEEDVCPGHECIGGGNRVNRHEYVFVNGSRIVLGGLDDQNRYYGSDWDVILLEEAVQFEWKEVEPFLGALRNGKLGWHAMIYATNPDAPGHWLKKRADDGLVKTYESLHVDNPSLWDLQAKKWTPKGEQFMGTLARYTGVAHARHVLGLWRGAEGQVWETYDERRHLLSALPEHMVEYRGSIDWGFYPDPGCFGVWGITAEKKACLVACWYLTKRNIEDWAKWMIGCFEEYGLTRVVADKSRNDLIDLCNDWLVKMGHHRMVFGADNRKAESQRGDLSGLDIVRWAFQYDKLFYYKNAMRHPDDENLLADGKFTRPWQEIPSYTLLRDARGEIVSDRTDPRCQDHGADMTRYFATDLWPRRVTPSEAPPTTYKDPYWSRIGTPEILLRNRLRRERLGEYGEEDDE